MNYTIDRFVGVNEIKFGMSRNDVDSIVKGGNYIIAAQGVVSSHGIELHFGKDNILHGIVLNNPEQLAIDSVVYQIPNDLDKIVKLDPSHYYYHLGTEIFPKLGIAFAEYKDKMVDIKILAFCREYFRGDGWKHKFDADS